MTRSPADAAQLAALRAGDESAFAELIARHHPSLVRVALYFVADRAAAEEVAQDTWMAVLRGLASFEGRSSLKTWIFRILTNRAKTRGTRDARSVPLSVVCDDEDAAVDPKRFDRRGKWVDPPRAFPDQTPEQICLRQEALARVNRGDSGSRHHAGSAQPSTAQAE